MNQDIVPIISLQSLGQIANTAARKNLLAEYQQEKSAETLRRQQYDIRLFEEYLTEAHFPIQGMADNLLLWAGITYGIVKGFRQWLLTKGYAIGSINVRLATIKTYCDLAAQAEYITGDEIGIIKSVKGFKRSAGRNVDEKRQEKRRGDKKASNILLSEAHIDLLKKQLADNAPDDKEVSRNYLLFCLLIDLGLRCGEIAGLETRNLDVLTGTLVFYRHKVDKVQTHKLTPDILNAANIYLKVHHPTEKLFDGHDNKRTGRQGTSGLTTRAINVIVGKLGNSIGINGLSPHDLRHTWATIAIRKGTDIKSLQQAGGWNSPYMPLRYAEDSEIANEGVKLK